MWQSIFLKEMERRRKIQKLNPELYERVWRVNPKGLSLEKECLGHVWVPATHLMLHDEKAKLVLGGVKRRAFKEAYPYKDEGYSIVPQICWKCDALRELEQRIMTTAEREQELIASRPKKERKKKYTIESSFDELFADVQI